MSILSKNRWNYTEGLDSLMHDNTANTSDFTQDTDTDKIKTDTDI